MSRKDLKQVAEENIQITKQRFYEANGVRTELVPSEGHEFEDVVVIKPREAAEFSYYRNNELKKYEQTKGGMMAFLLEDSMEAAAKLEKPLVMNFANAHVPGGGFLSGAVAQEECLCRESTLYASISSDKAAEMYEYNNHQNSPVDSDYMLLSPCVAVFRNPDLKYLIEPYEVAVMTVAAPNRNGAAKKVPKDELHNTLLYRINYFLLECIKHGYRNLVLGAWGCGAFGNDPKEVASIFYVLLKDQSYAAYFENIIFTFKNDEKKRDVFEYVFRSGNDKTKDVVVTDFIDKVYGTALLGDTIRRYGNAIKEHFVAYEGEDREAGKSFAKGLKDIAGFKKNPEYYETNVKQQAGFAAEVKTVARENAQKDVWWERNTRSTRTDDMGRQNDGNGHFIGGKNEELYDLAQTDRNGNYIVDTGRQLKYIGKDGRECAEKLLGKKYDKYRDADVPIEIPDDYYDEAIDTLQDKLEKVREQIKDARKKGKDDLVEELRKKEELISQTEDSLRRGKVKRDEAIFAVEHPKLSTAADVAKVANWAGMYQAAYSGVLTGSISIMTNVMDVAKGKITPEEAAKRVAKDTGESAISGYVTAFSGSVIKGAMQNAEKEYVRTFSKTNLAAGIINTTKLVMKTMFRYMHGEITGAQCVEELGKNGIGQLGATMYSTIGVMAVSGSEMFALELVAGMVSGMFGYAAAVSVYEDLKDSLNAYEYAKEERKRIEKLSNEVVEMIRQYRSELNESVNKYFAEHLDVFEYSLGEMDKAILDGDTDGFLMANAKIQEVLEHPVQFRNQKDFDEFMESDESLDF